MIKVIVVAVVLVIAGVFGWHMEYGTERTVTFTVKSLDDQYSAKSGHKYLVLTTAGDVYQNTDSWLHGKTDSSRVQALLSVGSTYQCPVYGYRAFWSSSYQDILDGCRQVSGKATRGFKNAESTPESSDAPHA